MALLRRLILPLRHLKSLVLYFIYRAFPIERSSALFSSFQGLFNDNPKYILLKLHEIEPQVKIYLAVSEELRDEIPDYVVPVRYGSLEYRIKKYSCQAYVDNYCCKLVLLSFLLKSPPCKKGQISVSTWHGTPLKKIGLDDMGSKNRLVSDVKVLADYSVAGCKHTAKILSRCFSKAPIPIHLTGTPRNDLLVNGASADGIAALKDKLRLPHDKKIFLFAPTFRDDVEESGVRQMRELNTEQILAACKTRFGGEWVFAFRVHNVVLLKIKAQEYASDVIIDGNIGDDMAEYLLCSDILMTDYSGSMFDYALTGRPCFLYAPDREHYEKKERGFYLDYDSLPFPASYTNEGLMAAIRSFDEEKYAREIKKFLADLGNIEDGHASERIAECIARFIRTGEKRLDTVNGAVYK